MAAVKTVHDEIRETHAKAIAIVNRAKADERDLSAAEQSEYDTLRATLERLATKQTRARRFEDLVGDVTKHAADGALAGNAPAIALAGRTPGQVFAESDAYREMIRGGLTPGPRPAILVEVPFPLLTNAALVPPVPGYPPATTLPPVPPGAPVLLPRTAELFARRPAPQGGTVPFLTDASTGAAAPVTPGAVKPEVSLVLPLSTAPLEMIAAWAKIAEQVLEDVEGVRQWVDSYLANKVLAALDAQLMAGTGVSPDLIGLVTLAGKTPDYPKGASESIADAVLAQILAVETASGLPCTAVALASDVYASISTAKAATAGVYLSGTPITDRPPTLLWGRAMCINAALAAGTAVVGSYLYGGALVVKGGMRIAMTNSDADDFQRNLVSVRAEIRCALCVNVPKAFGLVTGLTAA
jgi:hypothetical protein